MKTIIYNEDETLLNGFLQKGSRTLFSVSSSTPNSEYYSPEKALNTENSYFHSQGDFEKWYEISIKGYFYIKSYTILTRYTCDNYYPHEWNITASKDNKKWEQIDHKATNELNNVSVKKNFAVDRPGIYKHIKITQVKTLEGATHIFTFGAIDMFGAYISSLLVNSIRCSQDNRLINFIFILFTVS